MSSTYHNSVGRSSMSRVPQVYQIDFTAVLSGKRIASTKRRIRWRFGFANPDSLAAGQTGTACRGAEHDVTLVWSITSGKRLVLADGKEVHYSHSRDGVFDYSWTMRGNHVLKIVAHAAPPMAVTPGFRQYEFFVNGQSFFSFPKVFRLGLAPGDPRATASPSSPAKLAERGERYSDRSIENIAKLEAPHNPDEEEAYLQEAIRQSLEDDGSKDSGSKVKSGDSYADLLDFGTQANPPSSDPFGSAPFVPPSSVGPYNAQPAQIASTPWNTQSYQQPQLEAGSYPPTTNGYGHELSAPSSTSHDPWSSQNPPAPASSTNWQASEFGSSQSAALVPAQNQSSPWAATNNFAQQPAPATNQYSNYAPAPTPAAGPWTAPPPVSTSYGAPAPGSFANSSQYHNGMHVPSSVTPQAQQTPSSIGFNSPPADFNGFSPQPQQYELPKAPPEFAQREDTNPHIFTMKSLSSDTEEEPTQPGSTSLVEQAYAKLVNMDTFTLNSKDNENPFSSYNNHGGGDLPLADIQARKDKPAPAKPIMQTPASNALVVSHQQSSYGNQYGVQPQQHSIFNGQTNYGQPTGQQQFSAAQSGLGQQYGQPVQQSQNGYSASTNQYSQSLQQSQYGQSSQQPQFGQPPQQPQYNLPPPMKPPQPPQQAQFSQNQQQTQYGQPPQQPQQTQFGQPPQQPQFGQPPQQPQFGQPSQQPQYGQPPQQTQFGQPPQQPQYGQPPQQTQFGQPPQQSSQFGHHSMQSQYGQTAQQGHY